MAERRLRIAHMGIKGLPSKGGAERVIEAVVERQKQTMDVTVYCGHFYTPRGFSLPGVRFVRFIVPPGKYLRPIGLTLISCLHALLFGRYDLIHLHNCESGFVVPLLRLRFNVIMTSHGSAYRVAKWGRAAKTLMRRAEAMGIRHATEATCMSQELTRTYIEMFGRSVHCIPNGCDVTEEPDIEAADRVLREHGLEPGEFVAFIAGRIDPMKGCHWLFEAHQNIATDRKLLVLGDLEQVVAYGQQLREQADERTVFIPVIKERLTVFGILKRTHLMVFPSATETMSMILLEAASLGVPTLSSDLPENIDVLGDHALYFRSEDPKDLEEKLRWALENPGNMRERAEATRQRVAEQFTWPKVAQRYAEVYAQATRPRANPAPEVPE